MKISVGDVEISFAGEQSNFTKEREISFEALIPAAAEKSFDSVEGGAVARTEFARAISAKIDRAIDIALKNKDSSLPSVIDRETSIEVYFDDVHYYPATLKTELIAAETTVSGTVRINSEVGMIFSEAIVLVSKQVSELCGVIARDNVEAEIRRRNLVLSGERDPHITEWWRDSFR